MLDIYFFYMDNILKVYKCLIKIVIFKVEFDIDENL